MISTKDPVDLKTVNVETAVKLADDQQAQTFNAVDPNLKPFMARGGKLIVYHGWSDAALPPMGAINYYNSVEDTLGASAAPSFMRLYMVPGMQHCEGGPGADSFGQFAPAGDARARSLPGAGTMGGKRHGAGQTHRHKIFERRQPREGREVHAAPVRVSAGGKVQGRRRHE